ncbi:hypothetical protein ZWY2020_009216 [Hordeum vulgare]|nr:hypothetical protein ZWY2020_009216 [Hordeum vulgare]
MAHHIARQMVGSDANLADRARPSFSAPSAFGELPPRAGSSSWFTNPSVVFPEPTSSRSRQQNSQYEMCQETMLDREDNAGFTGETTAPPLYSCYNIERQAAAYYTRTVFEKLPV